jgi:RNA polymerase sigma factor
LDNLADQINLSKSDNDKKSELVEKYSPFIYNAVFSKVGAGDDDMLQIARLAFCEAIDNYSQSKGSFLTFAEIVMDNRMNDELRKRYKKQEEVFLDETEEEELLHKESVIDYEKAAGIQNRRDEVNEYLLELCRWGYSIDTLENYCPKHRDTREMCKFAAYILFRSTVLKEKVNKNKHLPVKGLATATNLNARFIEKHSKYITMIFIALNGSYHVIQEYIGGVSYGR